MSDFAMFDPAAFGALGTQVNDATSFDSGWSLPSQAKPLEFGGSGSDSGGASDSPVVALDLGGFGIGAGLEKMLTGHGRITIDGTLNDFPSVAISRDSIGQTPISEAANLTGRTTSQPAQKSILAKALEPDLIGRSTLSNQEARDAVAMGAIATDFHLEDAIVLKQAGVNLREIGASPTQLDDLNQTIAARAASDKDSSAAGVLVASGDLGSGVIAKLPGAKLPTPLPKTVPPTRPNGSSEIPSLNGGDGLLGLNSWSRNSDIKRALGRAVQDKGSDPTKTTAQNVTAATSEVLSKVNPITRYQVERSKDGNVNPFYPLNTAIQMAIIGEDPRASSTSLSLVKRVRDLLSGNKAEPVTVSEIMKAYDNQSFEAAAPNANRRLVGTTAGTIARVNPRWGADDYTATSKSIAEAQMQLPNGKWVKDPSATVRVTETFSEKSKPVERIPTKFGTQITGIETTQNYQGSKAAFGGQAQITNEFSPTALTRAESYLPRGTSYEVLWNENVQIPVTKATNISTTGVAIYPSATGFVFKRGIDKFNNPSIEPPGGGKPAARTFNWGDNGLKNMVVQTSDDFRPNVDSKNIVVEGHGSWKFLPGVVDGRAATGSWGKL